MDKHVERNPILFFTLCLYVLLLGTGLFHHELWMDESHHWLIARDSNSLIDLFNNYKYDGHPMLWVFCLWLIGKFTSKVIFVQIFHAFLSFSIAFVFLFKSPFKKSYSVLFLFSYYLLFEYGVLSRNYALTIFFLLLFCVTYKKNGKLLLPFFFLGLAANSHLFGLIFSVLLSMKMVYDTRLQLKDHFGAIMVFFVMTIFAFITIKAPSDHFFYFDWGKVLNGNKIRSLGAIWWKAIIPIPDLWNTHYWNTNFFTANFKKATFVLVLLSWGLPLLVLKRKSGYYWVFYCYALAILTFCLFTGLHLSQRVGGFLLFALVVLVWLEKKKFNHHQYLIKINEKTRTFLLYAFFFIQIISAGIFLVTDIFRPFSNTKNIYSFLMDNIEEGVPVYGGLYCNYIGLNNYGDLNLQIISQESELNYCDWRILNINKNKSFLEQGIKLMNSKAYEEMIFLTPRKLADQEKFLYEIQLIGHIKKGLIKNENAYIYRISQK